MSQVGKTGQHQKCFLNSVEYFFTRGVRSCASGCRSMKLLEHPPSPSAHLLRNSMDLWQLSGNCHSIYGRSQPDFAQAWMQLWITGKNSDFMLILMETSCTPLQWRDPLQMVTAPRTKRCPPLAGLQVQGQVTFTTFRTLELLCDGNLHHLKTGTLGGEGQYQSSSSACTEHTLWVQL